MKNKFDRNISLANGWFEYDYNKFHSCLALYCKELRKLEDIEHEATKPIACKSWTKCYHFGDEPKYMADLWSNINAFIEQQGTKTGWTYSHIETTEVDANTDPYEDYELLTDMYTVYAIVENTEDFKESKIYKEQEQFVETLHQKVLQLKQSIDTRLEAL